MNSLIFFIIVSALLLFLLPVCFLIVKSPDLPEGIPKGYYRELRPDEFLRAGDIALDGKYTYTVSKGSEIFKAGECTERFFRKI